MSSGDGERSTSREETPWEEHTDTVENLKEEPIKNQQNHDPSTLLFSRRGKITNDNNNTQSYTGDDVSNKKPVRRKGGSKTDTTKQKMRSSNSSLGRTSMGSEGQGSSADIGSEGGANRASAAVKKEEMERLEKELEQEIRYRDTIQWSVDVLQQSVDELTEQLTREEEGHEEESEYKLRSEAQKALNRKLEEQTEWYVSEVERTKEKINKGQEHTYDEDLDQYNEFELLRLMKSLERERNNLYSDLRNLSWQLDNHSKEYHHLKELIHAYNGDLTVVNRSLEHLWRQKNFGYDSAEFPGGSSPVTSPGGVKWNGQSGIRPSQRILDPRKGPIRKTAGVRSLPRLDQPDEAETKGNTVPLFRKGRSRPPRP